MGLCVVGPVGLVGFVGVIDKSPTSSGQTCQGVLGLVFHRFPGTSIRSHFMPVNGPSVSRFGIFFFWRCSLNGDVIDAGGTINKER